MDVNVTADCFSYVWKKKRMMQTCDPNPTSSFAKNHDERTDHVDQSSVRNSSCDSDFDDVSNVELRLDVDQQLSDDSSPVSALRSAPSEAEYLAFVNMARITLWKIRDILNQPVHLDYCEHLLWYLPIFQAAEENLTHPSAELSPETSAEGRRLFVFVQLAHTILKLLGRLMREKEASNYGPHNEIRSFAQPFWQVASALCEEMCFMEEAFFVAAQGCRFNLHGEDYRKISQRLKHFQYEVMKCITFLHGSHLEEPERPLTAATPVSAASESFISGSSRKGKKRWLDFVASDSINSSKRFCYNDRRD